MRGITERLLRMTAADLISRGVLTLSQWMPVQSAVRALTRVRVGGAPVVDEHGRCVGVFSLSDCNRRLRGDNRDARVAPPLPGCVCCDWTVVQGNGTLCPQTP